MNTDTQLTATLTTEILTAYKAAHERAKATSEQAREAILEACRCGDLLATAKAENRRIWHEWLATNLPDISPDEANRFISGSKKIKAAGLDSVNLNSARCRNGRKPSGLRLSGGPSRL
jgi:kynurenine formamidase